MDVESLAKELILKNMTPEQQMAVLDSVKASVAQAREVQKRKIGENVDIVVQALKTIESDIRSRFDDVGNVIEKRVASIKDGRDGSNGKDGRDGKDGKNGRDGAKGEKGETGQAGIDGVDGVDGVSVTAAHIDFDGSLIITLSTGVELNVGEVVAPDLAESIKVITNGGGTSQSVIDTLASLQAQITALIPSQTGNSGKFLTTNGSALSWANVAGGLSYQGTWNASTNSPTLTSSVGTNGYYYIVATAGSTNLNGITDWQIGDWLMYNGTVWQKIDQSNLVTSVSGKTGAVVLNNTDVSGFASIAAAGGTTVLTVSSAPNYVVTGSGGQTIQLPDATTLQNGAIFSFNNNQSSGTIIVKNNSSTTVVTVQSGGYVSLVLLSNSLAAGSWDVHNYAPSNVSWSTNTFDYAGSITSATWNGNAVAYNRGGTGQSSAFVAGGIVYGSTTSALAVTSIGTTGQVLTSAGAGTPTWTTPTTGTVTSVTGTSPVASSGGATPAISLAASYGDTQNPYASKTAKYVLAAPNGADGVPVFRAIVASDIPTLNQNTTGSAATLTTARAIYGNNFDGSAALTQIIASTYGGTGNGFSKFSGPATSEKTFTLPNASATILTDNALVTSAQGGTGNGFTKFTGATTAEKTYTLPDATTTILTTNAAVTVGQGGTGQTSYTDGQLLIGNTTGNTLTKATLSAGTGITITNGNGSISIASSGGSGVTSVTGTAPVVSSGGTTPAISLATGYGDTLNPYASKTANYFLSAPNGSAGVPTFRAIVSADIPTLNQNTTGSSASVTGNATGSTFGFNSGYGSVATAYGCRAWVNFNGTGTVAINASGNVTSITDNGVGQYTVNITTALVDANYSTVAITNSITGDASRPIVAINTSSTTSATAIRTVGTYNNNTFVDVSSVSVAMFR
jgi:hypothetical protein